MNAILFCLRCELKNSLRALLHQPARFFICLFAAVLLAVPLTGGGARQDGVFLDVRILRGVYFGFLLFLYTAVLAAGLRGKSPLFRPCDAALVLASPISPRLFLACALAKRMGASLFTVLLPLLYGAAAARLFGVTPLQILWMAAGGLCALLSGHVVSLTLCGLVGKRLSLTAARCGVWLFAILPAALVLAEALRHAGEPGALLDAVSMPWLDGYPLAGWMHAAVFSLSGGQPQRAALYGGILVLFTGAVLVLFLRMDPLCHEEAELPARRRGAARTEQGRHIRTSLPGGWGAAAFFFRHLREARRRSRLVFFNSFTLILFGADAFLFAAAQGFAVLQGGTLRAAPFLAVCLGMNCYLLFHAGLAGSWPGELEKPYVFLVPSGALAKLLWCMALPAVKPLLDAALVFPAFGLASGAGPAPVLTCILLYSGMGLVYLAVHTAAWRFTGRAANRGIEASVYLAVSFLLAAPGLAAAIFLFLSGWGCAAAVSAFLWDCAVFAVICFFCRGLLA